MVARKYAKALMDVMIKEDLIGPVKEDFENIRRITSAKKACDYLANRAVSKKEKMDVFLGCHPLTKSFLSMVIDNKRERELYDISRQYMDMLNTRLGEADVEVFSKIPLSQGERSHLKERLQERLKKKANMVFRTDKSIIGGLIVKYGGTVLDGTVNAQLTDMLTMMTA